MNVLFLMLIAAVCAVDTYKNPIIPTDAPDPGITFYDGKFYIVATTGGLPAYKIYESADGGKWDFLGYAFNETNKPKWATGKYWAPELHVINGKLMLYFSALSTTGTLAVGCASAPSPAGPWTPEDSYIVTHEYGTIDVTVAHDEQTGENYLVWKIDGNAVSKPTPFMMAKLDVTGTKITTQPVEILTNDLSWEDFLIEGPFFAYENGYYYLFYSANGYWTNRYAVGVARSKDIKGPYEKMPVPILAQYSDNATSQGFVSPGHGSVVKNPNTGAWYHAYHSWLINKIQQDPQRVCLIDRMWFDEDGWPVMGVSGTPSTEALPVPISKESADLPIDRRLVPSDTPIKLMCSQYDICWGEDGYFDEACNTKFYVRKGKLGAGTITFESVANPGLFWRHKNGILVLEADDGSELFKKDSSFIAVAGLDNQKHLTLRASNYPESVVRHSYKQIRLDTWDKSQLMGQDATWRIVQA